MISIRGRRLVAGSALVAAAVFKLASVLLWPKQGSVAVELTSAAAHPTAWTVASFLWLAFVACMGVGVLAAARLVRHGRGARLVQGGASVALLSMLAWGAMGALAVQEVTLASQPDRHAMVALYTDMKHSSALFVYVALVMLGELALFALFAGLRRARLVPVWQPLAMAGAIALDVAGDSTLLGVLESGLLFAAFATVGMIVLRMTDAEWEQPTSPLVPTARSGSPGAKQLLIAALLIAALVVPAAAFGAPVGKRFSVVASSYSEHKQGNVETFKEHLFAHGRRVGRDVVSCKPHGQRMLCHGRLFFRGGTILVRVLAGGGPNTSGKIVGGTRVYKGARGRITLRGLPHGRDRITIRLD